jgi:hypothetical protein
MELQDYVTQIVKMQRDKTFAQSPQLSLGELIKEIERCEIFKDDKTPKEVDFDFGSAVPTKLDSWRGSYSELALGYKLSGYDNDAEHFASCKADELLKELKDAIGKEYTGWKGGDYIMDENTPIWVANPGNGGETGIVGVIDRGYKLVILTAFCEF